MLLQLSVCAYAKDPDELQPITISVVRSNDVQSMISEDCSLYLTSVDMEETAFDLHFDKRVISISTNLKPQKYDYRIVSANAVFRGSFEVTSKTEEIYLRCVDFGPVIVSDAGSSYTTSFSLRLTHQNGDKFSCNNDEKSTIFYVPAYDGESYYIYSIIPDDAETYVSYTGHMYIYRGVTSNPFESQNLSDSYRFTLWEKENFIIKAPKGMEVYWAQQARYYTARDLQMLTKDEARSNDDSEYDYYIFDRHTKIDSYLLLRQNNKISRFCCFREAERNPEFAFGDWNADRSILTLFPLKDDPFTLSSDDYPYDSNVLTNANASDLLELKSGAYYDLVTLRTWQAVSETASNRHMDPEYHYKVIGDSVSVGKVDDYDIIQQFGRIQAIQSGLSCVIFTYDALESIDQYGSYVVHGALAPENTGVLVVAVDHNNTGIHTNIALDDLDTLYYLKSETNTQGITQNVTDHVTFKFTPTTDPGYSDEIKVRVHDPYMMTNGQLNINDGNDWLADSQYWTSYTADNGEFSLNLKEGRNIIEVSTKYGAEYRVIRVKGLDMSLTNLTTPNAELTEGDRVRISFSGMSAPINKLGALYNPTLTKPTWTLNGTEVVFDCKPYEMPTSVTCDLKLDEAGVYSFVGGGIVCGAYALLDGEELGTLHRQLTLWSRGSNYYGQSSENTTNVRSLMPDFSITVSSNDYKQELKNREAGDLLTEIKLGTQNMTKPVENVIPQSAMSTPMITKDSTMALNITMKDDAQARYFARIWNSDTQTIPDFVEITGTNGSALSFAVARQKPTSVEILVQPAEGYPYTYSRMMVSSQQNGSYKLPQICDVYLESAEGSGALGKFDGYLRCTDSITINDLQGNPVSNPDYGYGFLMTEANYSASVPHETDKVNLAMWYFATTKTRITSANAESTFKVTLWDNNNNQLNVDEPLNLEVGENVFIIKSARNTSFPYEYTLTITRREADKTIRFVIPDGATVLVQQNNKTVSANDDGTYTLADGTYTYHVSKSGFLTKSENFSVEGTDAEMTITVNELEPVPAQSGNVSVRIAGQDAVITPEKSIAISDNPADLAAKRYVRYNNGGYTVLHALIDACTAQFTCSNGEFVPAIDIDETSVGADAGWICKVNGSVCNDLANTLVNANDRIDFYYDSDYAGMQYARFAEEDLSVTEGSGATLTLLDGGDPIANANIYLGKTLIGMTDANGSITVPAEKLTDKRSYFVTAEKKNSDGKNALTCAVAIITVGKDSSAEAAIPGYTTVSFRLVGDAAHLDDPSYHNYTTWIGTTSYAFTGDQVSVGEVFKRALSDAGLTYEGTGYIESVRGLDGSYLAEFTNGTNSGWMYTVNGVHAGKDLNSTYVTEGDEIVWHYVDDYNLECRDGIVGTTTGNTSTWNTWYDAADSLSINAGAIVILDNAQITQNGTAFTATLPYGSAYPTAETLKVYREDTAATLTTPETSDAGENWTFSVTSECGVKKDYTLTVIISEQTAEEILAEAKATITATNWDTVQATANNEDQIKSFVEGKLATLELGGASCYVVDCDVTPAVTGTADKPLGTNGSFTATVSLSLKEATDSAAISGTITATEYKEPVSDTLGGTAQYVYETVTEPTIATTYGDWAILGLARSGYEVPNSYYQDYYSRVVEKVQEKQGVLHTAKYTEYSRVILALTAIGKDPADVGGYNLLTPLGDYENTIKQGNNSTAFALIALDSGNYEMPTNSDATTQATRQMYVDLLLNNQLDDGGWTKDSTGGAGTSVVDYTAMVLQALAKYKDQTAVAEAISKAISFLSQQQDSDGGFKYDTANSESCAQVLVAMGELGIPLDDARLVKNGKTVLDALQSYQRTDGSFRHDTDDIANQMSTEQALYALVSADRAEKGKPTLYTMTDPMDIGDQQPTVAVTGVTLSQTTASVEEGKTVTLTATVQPTEATDRTVTWESDHLEIATVENGVVTGIAEGEAMITAKAGEVSATCTVTVTKASTPAQPKTKITVTFSLLGDSVHDSDKDGKVHGLKPGGLTTWITSTNYELEEGAYVKDLFEKALTEAGISWSNGDPNYIESITYNGITLGEMTNGANSGWMYTLNGDKHPNKGYAEQKLSDGDVVTWHYTDDYTKENDVESWGDPAGSKKDEKKDGEAETVTTTTDVVADDGTKIHTETETTTASKTNDDGSVTETVTQTKTETATAPDGSKTVNETVTESEKTSNSEKNSDGSVTDTISTNEKVTETVTGSDGSKTVTDTTTESKTETTNKTNSDGSTTAKEATETKEKTTETVTAADGSKATTVTETTEKRNVETMVGADSKTTGSGTFSSTTTTTAADGSKTTAVTEGTVAVDTDEAGTVSAVTTATTKTTAADGTVTKTTTITTEAEMKDGTTGTFVEDGNGNTLKAEATISEEAVKTSEKTGEPIPVPVTMNPASGAALDLDMPDNAGSAVVEIPVSRTGPGIVAFQRFAGGILKLIKNCIPGSVIVPVEGDCELVIADNSKYFTDVDASSWYDYSVTFVTAREIFNGNGDGTFAPTGTMNRAMAAQMIYNYDANATAGDGSVFSDVSADAWYNASVGWAAGMNLITGYDGAYHPLADITRQDLVTILYRYAKQVGYDTEGVGDSIDLTAYADGAEVSDYAAAAMRWAIASGLVNGYEDGTLRPRNTATRAEVAAIMQRLVVSTVK